MVQFKLVISDPKTGKTVQKEASEEDSNRLNGMKIGDIVKGESVSLTGYEFEITGGSDYCGFPMRKDITGTKRKKILIVKGVGLKKTAKGMKVRKTVGGNTIHERIAQINLKIVKEGKENLFAAKKEGETKAEEAPSQKSKIPETLETPEESQTKAEAMKEEKPAEAPKEEKPKAEEKPKEKAKPEEPKEAPAEEKKEEAPKKEEKKE